MAEIINLTVRNTTESKRRIDRPITLGPVVKALWFHPGTAASEDYNKEIHDIRYTEA